MYASRAKPLTAVAVSLLLIASPSKAHDEHEQRIKELESQLEELMRRFEAQGEKPSPPESQAATTDAKPDANVVVKMEGPTPTIESADGQYSLKITGRVHADVGFYNQDAVPGAQQDVRIDPDLNSGTFVRRARLGVAGKIAGDWDYYLMLAAGGGADSNARLFAGYLQYHGIKPLSITVGRDYPVLTFNDNIGSNHLSFIERSVAANTASSAFWDSPYGLSVKATGSMWYADTGIWYGNATQDASDEFVSWTGRAAFVPINGDESLFHVGAHAGYLFEPEQDGRTDVTFSDRPELRVSNTRWVSASSQDIFANDDAYSYGFEVAARHRNVWFNGEVNFFGMDQSRVPAGGGPAGPDIELMSYSLEGGWIVTGEPKRYSMSYAAWSGVKPQNPFKYSGGGWGALELALRYSYADLNDEENSFRTDINGVSNFVGVRGGIERNFTFGVNWYVNDWVRFMFNYIHVDVDRYTVGQAPGAGGLSSGDTFDIFGFRSQFNF